MKKTLLLMISVFFVISAIGQSPNQKTRINAHQKQHEFDNIQNLLSKGEKLDSTISESWDGSSSEWVLTGKKKYAYEVNGNTTTVITSNRDAASSFQWIYADKTETTVNANGNITSDISYTWNKTTSQWVPSIKMEFTFNGTGKMTSSSTYNWDKITSQYVGIFKTEYTLDPGGNLIMDIGYIWDKTIPIPDWVKSGKTEHTYNGSGKNILDITYDWDKTIPIPDWVNSNKSEYTFDANGNITLETLYDWDKMTSMWVYSSRFEFTFNANGKKILYSFYIWDVNTSQWVGFLKTESTYGFTDGISYVEAIGSIGDLISGDWAVSTRITNYYSGLSTSIFNKRPEEFISVYPNPAKEYIVFNITTNSSVALVDIFDVQGRKVLEQRLSENKQISVSNLPKGLYIYKLINGGTIYRGKLLIE